MLNFDRRRTPVQIITGYKIEIYIYSSMDN